MYHGDISSSADTGTPASDFLYNPELILYFYQITDLNRPLYHQDKSADKVIDQVLRPKAQSDCNRTAKYCKNSKGYIDYSQGKKKQDQ